MENFKKEGKVSHRKHFTARKPAYEGSAERIYSTDRSFDDEGSGAPRSHYGERRSGGERKTYGDRKPAGDRKSYGERKAYSDRKPAGDRKPYGDRRPYGAKPGAKKFFPKKDDGIGRMIKKGKEQLHASLSDNDYVQPPVQDVVRLNKYIANSGVCSRREADSLIQSGCVTVNGEVEEYDKLIITGPQALEMVKPNSVVVVVDTQRPMMTDCPALLDRVEKLAAYLGCTVSDLLGETQAPRPSGPLPEGAVTEGDWGRDTVSLKSALLYVFHKTTPPALRATSPDKGRL